MRFNWSESTSADSELKAGDILFEMSDSGATHALIYLGSEKETGSKLTVAHADFVTHERVLKTSLPAGYYTVYRSKDPDLAKMAANLANNWATYNLPYDDKRLFAGNDIYSERLQKANHNLDTVLDEHRKDFNILDMIKNAGRAYSTMCLPNASGDDDDKKGMRCAMFVLICYQTAAALKAGIAKPVVGDGKTLWISNKHADLAQLESCIDASSFQPKRGSTAEYADFVRSKPIVMAQYQEHVKKLQESDIEASHPTYTPALAAWNFNKGSPFEFPIEKVLSPALILGTKTCNPLMFERALSQDKAGFEKPLENKFLYVQKKQYTKEETDTYKTQLKADVTAGKQNEAAMKTYLKSERAQLPSYDRMVTAAKK